VRPRLGGEHDESLVRALLGVRRELPDGALIVPVPLPPRPDERVEPGRDLLLQAHVAAAYGATHLLAEEEAPDAAIPTVVPEPWAYDADVEVWRPVARIEPDHVQAELTEERLNELLDAGEPVPDWFTPPAVAAELALARPPKASRGITVFFTGLSGSGKSTVARGLADALVERGGRTVTLLDGDVVRRMLSSGLTFSRADRDLNIRRIGFVAAEITRHGGTAICAPIAPYAATRAEVRRMVSAVGDFILVHVATPLEECERRDRKGLYAKARAGVIPEFTGISDPYETPDDADLTLDTSTMTPDEAVAKVLDLLVDGGWVRPA
jgi:sulfate adenylyltransferase